ncbi:hypothetical protein RO3G_15494 [Rhizopus delemar RA 99-880]|uniref:Tc1-like transposase DDE domain-containing protein n=1 Tax=Rhizopus delemar (strain RA 99-880 / ATCC MYA-4621 / FGSC 9543 / NRRL 43880) TaxID=246409 RepID=I1CQQ3_RHIO9|nr:hypothetical protein RO3G_15494 [Rhizopus delemar RA 99-880]|eukprot:EIE90783.1 hypothetical protein RO3G_15494 [Rhizopus delemar RA 99-880]
MSIYGVPEETYSPEQVQELLDLVIEEGLFARKAGAIVGIVERTAQNYVKTYKEDDEKRLPSDSKQRNPQAVLWKARDALLEAFSEIQSITLSGFHRHLVLHASLTLKKLEAIVSSRNTLGNLQIRRDRVLEWKSDKNMNWHKIRVFIDEAGFYAYSGITVSIIGAICEKGVIDLTLRKPKAVQKKTNSNKKRKREDDKAEVVEANAMIGTRSEHFIEFLIGVMDTLDQFDMKGCYLFMDNAAIHKVTELLLDLIEDNLIHDRSLFKELLPVDFPNEPNDCSKKIIDCKLVMIVVDKSSNIELQLGSLGFDKYFLKATFHKSCF